MLTRASPTSTQKEPRQEPTLANMPPSSGERAAPADRKPLHRATAWARSRLVRVTAVIAVSDPGNMAPAPRPLRAAPTQRTCTVGASAATVLPAATRAVPATTRRRRPKRSPSTRSEEHTSELQSRENLVCRLLLEKKKKKRKPAERRHTTADAR